MFIMDLVMIKLSWAKEVLRHPLHHRGKGSWSWNGPPSHHRAILKWSTDLDLG